MAAKYNYRVRHNITGVLGYIMYAFKSNGITCFHVMWSDDTFSDIHADFVTFIH